MPGVDAFFFLRSNKKSNNLYLNCMYRKIRGIRMKSKVIEVQNVMISISEEEKADYICITDIAGAKGSESRPADIVRNWIRNRATLEYLSTWEQIYNPDFKVFESEHFKKQAGLLTFTPSVSEWINQTNAIGLYVKRGKYGGTYAHKDIAFEFGMWISPKFKLLLIKEFERLKAEEQKQIGWNAKRELSKINYRIHTDAIKNNLIPKELSKNQINFVYAEEADVLNMALFGMTAKEWRTNNPDLDGNIRDYATMNELICLANLENLNSVFIKEGLKQSERLEKLNKIAISQMQILNDTDIKYLK